MADLQARIGPKATQLYPNLTWKRPGADLKSPSKNTPKWSQTRRSDEKDDDSDASSHEHASSPIPSSPNKSRYRSSYPRPRSSSGPLSLLTRMGLSSNVSEDGSSVGKEEASIEQSLLLRVGTTEDTPRSRPNIGSTIDSVHVPDSNHTAKSKPASPQAPLPSSSSAPRNAFVPEQQPPDDGHNHTSRINSNSGQTKSNDGLVVKPSSPETLHKSILQDFSNSHYSSNSIRETPQTRLEDQSVPKKITIAHPSQERNFEDGELVDSEVLPSQQVRNFILPLVLKNAAHRVKEGDSDLAPLSAHSVLSDEVCSSFMDQMKEVRTEMHAHKNRSSTEPPQPKFMGETNNSGAGHTSPSSKIGQAPPAGPRAMIVPIVTGKYIPPNGETLTQSSLPREQVISASSSHFHDSPSPSRLERRESGFRHTPSPERRGFHDRGRGRRRYSQHRERFHARNSRSHSHSPSRYSRGQYYRRPSDSSRHMARSRSPLITSPGRRRSPPSSSQSTYFRDRAIRESPEVISDRRSVSPSANNRMLERRESLSRDFKRIERPGNISPRRDTTDSPRSPVSRRYFGRRGVDKVVSPSRPSYTHDRGRESFRDSHVRSGSEFARRSASPPRRRQDRQISKERPRAPLPRSATPNAYCQSQSLCELDKHSAPRSLTPNPYLKRSFESERCRDCQGTDHMESMSPGTGSMSTHLTSYATNLHHSTLKSAVIDPKDLRGRVNEEVKTPKKSDDMPKSRPGVLPCHNVPGVWFVKVALGDIGILECSFEVDDLTARNWNLRPANVNLPNKVDTLRKEKLQLHICCLSQKDVQSVMDSLKPDATAQDVATAMLTIENDWPTPGHLIIMVNPQDKKKRVWLPDKLESPYLPVYIEDCVVEGQNIVQFIQLSGISERMFVLFATTRPLSEELQHDDEDGFVLAPLQNTINGGKEDILDIGFGQVTILDLE